MTENIPFQNGMLLGRTYDLRRHTIGSDIFEKEYTANPEICPCTSTRVNYKVIKNSSDVNDVLEVSGDLSLKVKAGILNVKGMGNYLKEIRSEENALEILAVARVETVCTTLWNATLSANWNKNNKDSHYIRSITYGGELLIKISYIASDSKQKEEIKARVNAGFQFDGIIDAEGAAALRKLDHDLKEKTEINLCYYGTTLSTDLPKDMESMLKTLNDLPNQLLKMNDGKGTPLRCELVPLTSINPGSPSFQRNTSIELKMRDLEDTYDDIRQSHAMLLSYLEDNAEHISKEQEEKGNEIGNRIYDVKSDLDKVIGQLDVMTDDKGNKGQITIEGAIDFYHKNKHAVTFRTEVKRFINEVQQLIPICASVRDFPKGKPLSILLVGVTGHGKSATANSILGEYKFSTHMGCESVWSKCQKEHGIIEGREVDVVDTPGSIYIDTSGSYLGNHYDQKLTELETAFNSFGYHALLFVLSIDVRINTADIMAITMLKEKFGDETLKKYGIIIFTHGDSFERNMKKLKHKTSFEEYINTENAFKENFLTECNNRYALIDNLEQDPGRLREQVISIIELIDKLVEDNKGITYKWTAQI